jgi:hypothetical protein
VSLQDWELDSLQLKADSATAGPWEYHGDPSDRHNDPYVSAGEQWICATSYDTQSKSRGTRDYHADAVFIAAAREAVPALIAEVRRLKEYEWMYKDLCQ